MTDTSVENSTGFVAYTVYENAVPLEPASRWRDWMEQAPMRWPTRCLPLLMANESGWVLRLTHDVRVSWSGQPDHLALEIDQGGRLANSVFGMGIVTFSVPYLFRVPPGWDLIVRGPVNSPKDGIYALEGLVEADWVSAPFTMNWQLTRPDFEVEFTAGEPYCHVMPVRRWDLESLEPRIERVASEPELEKEVATHFRERRGANLMKKAAGTLGYTDKFWDQKYFRGLSPLNVSAPEHRKKRRLQRFEPEFVPRKPG